MSVNGVTQTAANAAIATGTTNSTTKKNTEKAENTAKTAPAATYEKSEVEKNSTKKIYSDEDRSALIEKLKKDAEEKVSTLKGIVEKLLNKQFDNDDFWKKLANGEVKVDEETRANAQKSLEGDGEYSVKTVSENILSFAKALTGGDVNKIEDMRKAFQKGFDEATQTWGKQLPKISQDTYDAVMKGFDDWAKEAQTNQSSKNISA